MLQLHFAGYRFKAHGYCLVLLPVQDNAPHRGQGLTD